jgi:hypothetical protein
MALGDDALRPDNVTARDGIGPDKVGPFKSLIKVNPHQLTLQPSRQLSDELGLARATFTAPTMCYAGAHHQGQSRPDARWAGLKT